MKFKALHTFALAALLLAAPVTAASAQDADAVARIEAALPAQPTAQPQAPRKLLVFNRTEGFAHGSIPVGAKALEMMGAKTGAYTATLSDDTAVFAPDSLAQFDAVVMNNTTGELFADPALKQSLLDFVRNGKGTVGIHAATDCCYNWAEYGEMMGGYFDGHPWGGGDTVGVKLDDPAHPLVAAFNGQGFKIQDEIYQFRDPYSRERLRVLLSLDPANTDMNKGDSIRRTDGDFAISWVQSYGSGRVFYCSLGHNDAIFWNPAVLQHFLDGIQFAMGDIAADTTPSAKLSAEHLAQSQAAGQQAALDRLVAEIARADYGQAAEAFTAFADMVNKAADPEAQRPIAEKLAALLASDATANAKQFASEQLSLIGGEEVIPALAQALANPDTFEWARYALERNPAPAATEALLAALPTVAPMQKLAIVNALGAHKAESAVTALAPLAGDPDNALAEAAIDALAQIPAPAAAEALLLAKANARPELQTAAGLALLRVAERFQEAGEPQKAGNLLAQLYAPTEPKGVRLAAFKRIVALLGEKAAPLLVDRLKSDDAAIQAVVVESIPEVPGSAATELIAGSLAEFSPAVQVPVIAALAARGDQAALPAVTQAAAGADEAVRVAALTAMAALGDAATVPALATAAAESEGDIREAARESLNRLAAPGADEALLQALDGQYPPAVRAEVIRAAAARRTQNAVPALLKAADDADEAVRAEAIRALGILAAPQDMPLLVSVLVNAPEGNLCTEAEKAVVSAASRLQPGANTADVLAALPDAQANPAKHASVVRVLGRIGDDSGLDAVRGALQSADPAVKDAAVRAMADWPTPAPLSDLLGVASAATDDAQRGLALRGYLRLLTIPSSRPSAETLALYEQGMQLAKTPEETKLALAGLSEVRDPRVYDVLKPYADNPDFAAEAKAALDRLAQVAAVATASDNPDAAKDALDGDPETRWATGRDQAPGQWFQVDLGWERPVSKVVIDSTASAGDYARGYKVFVSSDPANWGEPVATGDGVEGQPVITLEFPTTTGRFVRIEQTGETNGLWWSIHELTIQ